MELNLYDVQRRTELFKGTAENFKHFNEKKIKIKKEKGFLYADQNINKKVLGVYIDLIKSEISKSYLSKTHLFQLEKSHFEKTFKRELNQKKFNGEIFARKLMDNISSFILRYFSSPKFQDKWIQTGIKIQLDNDELFHALFILDEKSNSGMITLKHYQNSPCKHVLISSFSIDLKSKQPHFPVPVIMYSENESFGKRVLQIIEDNVQAFMTQEVIVISEMIKTFEQLKDDDIEAPKHIDSELHIMQKMMTETKMQKIINIFEWKNPSCESFLDMFEEKTLKKILSKEEIIVPVLDLNEKEWRSINKWVDKKLESGGFDLKKVLNEQPYGEIFQTKIPIGNYRENDVTFMYINAEIPLLFINYKIDEYSDMKVIIQIDLNNHNGVNLIRSDYLIHSAPKQLIPTYEELFETIPVAFLTIKNVKLLYELFMNFFIISHFQPERNRMISESKTEIKRKRSHKKGVYKDQEVQSVVRRILKPAKAAKEYIKTMNSDSTRIFEYTLESWKRVGHIRRYKSGKEVWIEPTVCKRQQPLTDKEIVIKL